MTTKMFTLGAALLLFAACSDELGQPDIQTFEKERKPLEVNVTNTPTKSQITGTLLPKNSSIGVFLTKSDGTPYLSANNYDNMLYTGTGTIYAETWTVDPAKPVYLYAEKATAYAYYPRKSSASLTSISITNDGTDWMYSDPVEGLYLWNTTANFSMKHAMSIIRVKIARVNDLDVGTVSKVTLDGTGWATGASINLKQGNVGSFTGVGNQLVKTNLGSLSATPLSFEHWVVPNNVTSDITFKVQLEDHWFHVTASNVTLVPGKVYNYTLTISNKTGLLINSVALTDWINTSNSTLDTQEYAPPVALQDTWSGLANGVYLVRPDFKPAAVPDVADESTAGCIGVALVNSTNNQRFMIEKHEENNPIYKQAASGKSSTYNFYWGGYGTNQSSITDYATADEAKADFSGATWSNYLVSVLTGGSSSTSYATIGAVLKAFREANHLGKSTWYIPAGGQMNLIYQNLSAVNAAIEKIGGTKIQTTNYWTSSEVDENNVYRYTFSSGSVTSYSKTKYYRLRLLVNL